MTRFSEEYIEQLLSSAHQKAFRALIDEISSDMSYNEPTILRYYKMELGGCILEEYLKNESKTPEESLTLDELEKNLIAAGFSEDEIEIDGEAFMCVETDHCLLFLECDSFGRSILCRGKEYNINAWNDGTVRILKLIKEQTSESMIFANTRSFVKAWNGEWIHQRMIEATARSLISETLSDDKCTFVEARSCKGIFSATVETSWGRVEISSNLQELPNHLEEILQEKQKIEQMFVTFDDQE